MEVIRHGQNCLAFATLLLFSVAGNLTRFLAVLYSRVEMSVEQGEHGAVKHEVKFAEKS